MKIVIAPDSFKGSLSAGQVADCIAEGIHRVSPDIEVLCIPLADGGEGTVEALVKATHGSIIPVRATDPLGHEIDSSFGILGDGKTAVVEMAAASGIQLIPESLRNPMLTTTYGTGELILQALETGCEQLILGIGGSATNDGGVGMAQALGGKFLDRNGCDVGFGGGKLADIYSIDLSKMDSRIGNVWITVACDVTNPLTGSNGASAVFGPQKGATPEMVQELDAGLKHLAEIIRRDLGLDVENSPGAGAAGGMGAATLAFLKAELKSGIEIILEATRFNEHISDADLVITGEGRIDSQTLQGKTINGVLRAARAFDVPVLAIGGGVENGGYELSGHGDVAVFSIVNKPMLLDEACADAPALISRISEQAVRLFRFGTR